MRHVSPIFYLKKKKCTKRRNQEIGSAYRKNESRFPKTAVVLVDYSSGRVLLIYLLRTQSRTMAGDFSRLCALMREGRADQIEELYRDRIKAIKTFRQQNYDIMDFRTVQYSSQAKIPIHHGARTDWKG